MGCCTVIANTCASAYSDSSWSCPAGKVKITNGLTYSSSSGSSSDNSSGNSSGRRLASDTKEEVCCKENFACEDSTDSSDNSANIDAGLHMAAPGGVALVVIAGAALVAAQASSATS